MCDQNSCMHAKCQNQMNQFLSLGFMVLTGMHVLYHKFELWCLLWILYISGQAWLMLTGHGYFYLLFVYFILLTFQKFSRLLMCKFHVTQVAAGKQRLVDVLYTITNPESIFSSYDG